MNNRYSRKAKAGEFIAWLIGYTILLATLAGAILLLKTIIKAILHG